jgi:hypothetical protein
MEMVRNPSGRATLLPPPMLRHSETGTLLISLLYPGRVAGLRIEVVGCIETGLILIQLSLSSSGAKQ